MPKRKARLRVSFDWPEGADEADLLAFVEDAVTYWGGGLMPPGVLDEFPDGDPMFGSRTHVAVRLLKR